MSRPLGPSVPVDEDLRLWNATWSLPHDLHMLHVDQPDPDAPEARVRTVAAMALALATHDGRTDPAMELFHLAEGDPHALADARHGLRERPTASGPDTIRRAIVDLGTAELWALVAPGTRAALAR